MPSSVHLAHAPLCASVPGCNIVACPLPPVRPVPVMPPPALLRGAITLLPRLPAGRTKKRPLVRHLLSRNGAGSGGNGVPPPRPTSGADWRNAGPCCRARPCRGKISACKWPRRAIWNRCWKSWARASSRYAAALCSRRAGRQRLGSKRLDSAALAGGRLHRAGGTGADGPATQLARPPSARKRPSAAAGPHGSGPAACGLPSSAFRGGGPHGSAGSLYALGARSVACLAVHDFPLRRWGSPL